MQDKFLASHLSDDQSLSHEVIIGLNGSELSMLRNINKWIACMKWGIIVFGIIGTIAHLVLLLYTERWILMSLIHSTGSPGRPPAVLPIFAIFEIFLVLGDALLIVLKIRVLYFLTSFHYAFNLQGVGFAKGTMLQITVLRVILCGIGFSILYNCSLQRISLLGFWLLVFSCGLGNLVFEVILLLVIRHIQSLHGNEKRTIERIRQIAMIAKRRLTINDFRMHTSQNNSSVKTTHHSPE